MKFETLKICLAQLCCAWTARIAVNILAIAIGMSAPLLNATHAAVLYQDDFSGPLLNPPGYLSAGGTYATSFSNGKLVVDVNCELGCYSPNFAAVVTNVSLDGDFEMTVKASEVFRNLSGPFFFLGSQTHVQDSFSGPSTFTLQISHRSWLDKALTRSSAEASEASATYQAVFLTQLD